MKVNHVNDDDKCFKYSVSVAVNYERISKTETFINKYN